MSVIIGTYSVVGTRPAGVRGSGPALLRVRATIGVRAGFIATAGKFIAFISIPSVSGTRAPARAPARGQRFSSMVGSRPLH